MIYLSILGILGIIICIFGFFMNNILKFIVIIVGVTIAIIFLWPALGLITVNLTVNNDRYQAYQIIENLRNNEPKLLDVGCGTGRAAISIAKNLKNGGIVCGIDIFNEHIISNNSIHTIQKNAKIENVDNKTEFKYGSALDIPYNNNEFDLVNTSFVLHEFSEKENALNEIKRVLKQNGIFCLTEFNRFSFQSILINGIFSLVFKDKKYWNNVLINNGFKEIEMLNKGPFIRYFAKK